MKEIENGGSLEIGQRTNWLFCKTKLRYYENATILKP
jgi:hypothetical protein